MYNFCAFHPSNFLRVPPGGMLLLIFCFYFSCLNKGCKCRWTSRFHAPVPIVQCKGGVFPFLFWTFFFLVFFFLRFDFLMLVPQSVGVGQCMVFKSIELRNRSPNHPPPRPEPSLPRAPLVATSRLCQTLVHVFFHWFVFVILGAARTDTIGSGLRTTPDRDHSELVWFSM